MEFLIWDNRVTIIIVSHDEKFFVPCALLTKKGVKMICMKKIVSKKREKAILYELSPLEKIQQIFAKSEVEKRRKISKKWNNQKITTTSLLKRAEIRTADSSRQGKRSYLRQFKRIKRNVVQKCWRKVANNRLRNSMKIGRKEKEFNLPVKSYVPTSNCLLTEDNKLKQIVEYIHWKKYIKVK